MIAQCSFSLAVSGLANVALVVTNLVTLKIARTERARKKQAQEESHAYQRDLALTGRETARATQAIADAPALNEGRAVRLERGREGPELSVPGRMPIGEPSLPLGTWMNVGDVAVVFDHDKMPITAEARCGEERVPVRVVDAVFIDDQGHSSGRAEWQPQRYVLKPKADVLVSVRLRFTGLEPVGEIRMLIPYRATQDEGAGQDGALEAIAPVTHMPGPAPSRAQEIELITRVATAVSNHPRTREHLWGGFSGELDRGRFEAIVDRLIRKETIIEDGRGILRPARSQ